jgi:hypothetical protein
MGHLGKYLKQTNIKDSENIWKSIYRALPPKTFKHTDYILSNLTLQASDTFYSILYYTIITDNNSRL